uniref:Non-structural maintenance of chromosomes element 4 n=1 Tax=Podarcis muralis TaxID=64176 RepID=A0A670K5K1_PODMU
MAENHKEEEERAIAETGPEASDGGEAAHSADPPVVGAQVKGHSSPQQAMTDSAESEDMEESCDDEATIKEAERILGLLKVFYREGGESPINFFKFVTDPNSFAQTLDNMYHVLYLARHGLARIKADEDEIPVLEPLDPGQGSYVLPQTSGIIPLSIACWEQIVEVFEISQPMIPPAPEA